MKRLSRTLAVLTLLGGAVWLWLHFYPSPETAIRRQLQRLGATATFAGRESLLARGLAAQKFGDFFAPQVHLQLEPRNLLDEEVTRQDLIELMVRIRSLPGVQAFKVRLLDPVVTLAADREHARVEVTVNAESSGERHRFVQELELGMARIEGEWRITTVATVRVLNRAPAVFFMASQ
ncbi:MAG TPA: hypothetical protein PKN95_05665 [Verrucomicrobiota bacterium]|nr:hypothetical protein [Verrucomicrobiota bacterium]HNT15385.1 hypothetical protein [Verrucomicrobiota bacterium]